MKSLLWLFLFAANVAAAAVISVRRLPNENLHIVVLSGDIERSDAERFSEKVSGISKAVVVLDSPGGSVLDGIAIGRSIRSKGYHTAVPDQTMCASSCALIWLGGSQRFAEDTSLVGFHAAYVYRNGKAVEVGVGNALIGSYLNELGLSDSAIIFVTNAPPEGIERLDRRKAQQVGIAYRSVKASPSANDTSRAALPSKRAEVGIRSNAYDPVTAVTRFYKALRAADGNAAAALVVPEKRGIGSFNERNISSFYGGLKEPLMVESIELVGGDAVQVKYSYRFTKTQCAGIATVSTEYLMGNTLIKGIKANC